MLKLSELIEHLEQIREEHGDIPVDWSAYSTTSQHLDLDCIDIAYDIDEWYRGWREWPDSRIVVIDSRGD